MAPDSRLGVPFERAREPLVRGLGLAFLVFGAYYLTWRAGWTLNFDALWLALPLILAEAHGYLDFALFLFMTWHIPPVEHRPAPEGLGVDVYITTYNEDLEVIRSTVVGALNMRYPHQTYVLDDGQRPAVRRMAQDLGAKYLTRRDRTHAKAGNLNHALARTSGEFIAVFDADHVPHPQFLERTLGFFADDGVALVQTPQEFYNLDSLQHAGRRRGELELRWHEQALFYHVIQPGKDRWNSAFWCGTNAVLRRSALDSIGGVATETITEDMLTTVKLHAAGWRTRYLEETLATGIAPDDLDAFLAQRRRWAQGTMHVLRSRYNPLWARGLSIPQRLSYWASMTTYFSAFQKIIFLTVPLVVLTAGVLPMRAFGWDFVAHFVPYFVFGQVASSACGRGYLRYLEMERFNLLKAFTFIRASLELFIPRRLRFQVTRKSLLTERRKELAGALPHMVLLFVIVCSLAWGLMRLALGLGSEGRLALQLNAVWAFYNGAMLGLAIKPVLSRPHRRSQYRFEAQLPITVTALGGTWRAPFEALTLETNPHGVGFYAPRPLATGAALGVILRLPDRHLDATAHVMNCRPAPGDGGVRYRVGARFVEVSESDRDALTQFLFEEVALPRPGGATPAEPSAEERAA